MVPGLAFGYAEGPPPGYSNVPGELGDCSECHSGGKGSGSVTVAFPGGSSLTYTPGVSQTLNVTVADPVQIRWGFQLAARLAGNPSTLAGQLTPGSDGFTQLSCASLDLSTITLVGTNLCTGSGAPPLQYIEHTALGTRDDTTVSATFTFTWTPPATNVGDVIIYVAGNAANGDTTPDGDHIYTNTYTLTPAAAAPAPQITGVLNGATFQSTMAASTYLSIFGSNLSTSTTYWSSSVVNGAAPTLLAGATVTIGGANAYIEYASPGQLNVVAPAITATGNGIPVIVSVNGQPSTAFNITLQNIDPSFFFWTLPSPNSLKYLIAQHSDYTRVGSVGLFPGNSPPTTPAQPGETIILYGTGFGPTTPAIPPGTETTVFNNLVPTPTATVGGITATVAYAGLAIGFCEFYQVNLTIPPSAPSGEDLAVVLKVNGTQSFAGYITVQQ
jgi:uncharacterized protein (TIGR03437 family)